MEVCIRINTARLTGQCCGQYKAVSTLSLATVLSLVQPAQASEMEEWLSSEARTELITEFEANDCRLTLTEVSDILFDHDASEEHMYTERLFLMEPEATALSFPVVLIKSPDCSSAPVGPIDVPEAALAYAAAALAENSCVMDIGALEALVYPVGTDHLLSAPDRRNIVSELYNRGEVTFRYSVEKGVDKLQVHKLKGTCAAKTDK